MEADEPAAGTRPPAAESAPQPAHPAQLQLRQQQEQARPALAAVCTAVLACRIANLEAIIRGSTTDLEEERARAAERFRRTVDAHAAQMQLLLQILRTQQTQLWRAALPQRRSQHLYTVWCRK